MKLLRVLVMLAVCLCMQVATPQEPSQPTLTAAYLIGNCEVSEAIIMIWDNGSSMIVKIKEINEGTAALLNRDLKALGKEFVGEFFMKNNCPIQT